MQEREAAAKQQEVEEARREATEKAKEYEDVRSEVRYLQSPFLRPYASLQTFPRFLAVFSSCLHLLWQGHDLLWECSTLPLCCTVRVGHALGLSWPQVYNLSGPCILQWLK